MKQKIALLIRLREEDKKLIEELAKRYDISEADIVRIALKEFIERHEVKVSS
ncbi:ribbon-helix-helix domain-containing protein [Saccharolobus islandicus]|uniref:ribbon-helix-helix protein, CopG family n=1 Tax=Saccharolobus islandicus TaxID=43080 RepID=UPI000373377E|nr:ribbon-helix-helix protein, CopG family [Sulfolobus islandicus]